LDADTKQPAGQNRPGFVACKPLIVRLAARICAGLATAKRQRLAMMLRRSNYLAGPRQS
jgi:hypothetical protein